MNILNLSFLACIGLVASFSFEKQKGAIEAAIDGVRDLEITEFAAQDLDLQGAIEAAIDGVRDLEITEFAAQDLDLQKSVEGSIAKARDLDITDFAKEIIQDGE